MLVLLLGATGLAYLWTPTDLDLWWHLRNGQLVLESGVPATDVFSFTVAGTRWIMHEWLTDTAMALLYQGAGYGLLLALFAAISVVSYALLYRVLRAAGAGPALAVALLAVRIMIEAPAWGVHPQILTPFLFTIFVAILWGYRQRTTIAPAPLQTGWRAWVGPDWRLWLLAPLTWLWSNVHGGFIVGPILLGVWFIGEAINGALGWQRAAPLRPLLAVGVAGGLLSLLNPNGLDQWLYPLSYTSGGQANNLLLFVQEWQPPDPRKLQTAPLLLTLLTLVGVALLRPRQPEPPAALSANPWGRRLGERVLRGPLPVTGDATLLLAMGLFLLMALQAMRLQPQWGTVWAVGMAVCCPGCGPRWAATAPGRPRPLVASFTWPWPAGRWRCWPGRCWPPPKRNWGPSPT